MVRDFPHSLARSRPRRRPRTLACALLLGLAAAAPLGAETVVHVDHLAPPGGDGATWQTAYRFPTDALAAALVGSQTRIKVAQGTYRPDRSAAAPNGTGDRDASFVLVSGVIFEGGYAGLGAADPDHRDIGGFVTILSGDLAQDDDGTVTSMGENSRHVVRFIGAATISGTTIVGGNSDGEGLNARGGGLRAADMPGATLVIERCRVVGNRATLGGGAYFDELAEVEVIESEFSGNLGGDGGGLHISDVGAFSMTDSTLLANVSQVAGAGAFFRNSGAASFTRCQFLDNLAGGPGGGLGIFGQHGAIPTVALRDCILAGNSAAGGGGAFLQRGSSIVGCVFADNIGDSGGGGVFTGGLSPPGSFARIVSSAFVRNQSSFYGSGIATGIATTIDGSLVAGGLGNGIAGVGLAGGAILRQVTIASHATPGIYFSDTPILQGSIVWANGTPNISSGSGELFASHSIIEGGWSGTAILDADPLFVAPETLDYRLLPGSPAIDAGSVALLPPDLLDLDGDGNTLEPLPLDLIGAPRVVDGAPDFGAIEFTGAPLPPFYEVQGVKPGESVVLIPPSDLPWQEQTVAADFTNLDDDGASAEVALEQFGWTIHRGATGFSEDGLVGRLTTTLSDGAHFTRIRIPFDGLTIPLNELLKARVTVFDAAVDAWRVAPVLNTVASPGHAGPIGDWSLVLASLDDHPPLSAELGDHGIVFDPVKLKGFAWANVDRAGDFGIGRNPCVFDLGPSEGDGVIDGYDLGALLANWGGSGVGDLDGNGVVESDDLALLLSSWGGCAPQGGIAGGEPPSDGAPPADAWWAGMDGAELGRRLARWESEKPRR